MKLVLAWLAMAAPLAPAPSPPEILGAAKTIQVSLVVTNSGVKRPYTVVVRDIMEQPNKIMAKASDAKTGALNRIVVCDGVNLISYDDLHHTVTHAAAPLNWKSDDYPFHAPGLSLVGNFLTPGNFKEFHAIGPAIINGKPAMRYSKSGAHWAEPTSVEAWINAKTGLPIRLASFITIKGKVYEDFSVDFFDWKLNEPINPAVFTDTPSFTAPAQRVNVLMQQKG